MPDFFNDFKIVSMKNILNKRIIGLLISLIFIVIIANQIDIDKTIKSFGFMNPIFIVPIIPIYLISFILRAFRWRILLNKEDLQFSSLLSSIFIGFSLNCVLPARTGEIYRAYFFSKKEKLSKTKVFTSVILERVFDGLTLFLMLIFAIYFICPGDLFFKIAFSAGIMFLSGFIFLMILVKTKESGNKREQLRKLLAKISSFKNLPLKIKDFNENFLNKIFTIINSFIEALDSLNSWKLLGKSVLYSCFIWLMEGAFMLLVINSFGLHFSLLNALLVLSVTAFSTLIPAGPAGIGPYQWGYIIALKVFGIEPELGLAISIINQLLSILLILVAGFFSIWKNSLNWGEIKENLQEKQSSHGYYTNQ